MTRFYLAGKIRKNDWRHYLVPGLREHEWDQGDLLCRDFTYTGPFFIGCDHGCYHGAGKHGAFSEGCIDDDHRKPTTWEQTVARCHTGVVTADLVFAYIETLDCIGSMVEVGIAIANRIPVILCAAPSVDAGQLRFPAAYPQVTLYSRVTLDQLKSLFHASVEMASARNVRGLA